MIYRTIIVACVFVTSRFIPQFLQASSPRFFSAGVAMASASASNIPPIDGNVDTDYPGTATSRMLKIRERVRALDPVGDLSGNWSSTRVKIINAGGLFDLQRSAPGLGYTGHAFNDYNHCDLTAMKTNVKDNTNEGRVAGIAFNNRLGQGIEIASIGEPELPSGGSWSTCMIGCHLEPPQDVAHVQFRSRIAFKLVWVPPAFASFVLVDDDGRLLNSGTPVSSKELPPLSERSRNYAVVKGSKYAVEADRFNARAIDPADKRKLGADDGNLSACKD
jgi:hypothetical protein